MHCVEKMEEIGKKCNLTLFTYQQIIYALYAKPSMKLAGWVSSVAVLVLQQVTETVVEEIFVCSWLGIECPGVHLEFFSDDIYVSYSCISYSLCWSYSVRLTSIWEVISVINPFPCNFIQDFLVTEKCILSSSLKSP